MCVSRIAVPIFREFDRNITHEPQQKRSDFGVIPDMDPDSGTFKSEFVYEFNLHA